MVYEDYIRVFDGESAVEFDGNAGSARCDASPVLNLTQELTLEAWIKPSGWGEVPSSGYGRIIDKENFALYLIGESGSYNNQSLAFLLKNTSGPPVVTCSPAGTVELDEWQHVAATYSASSGEVTLLIGGLEQELSQTSIPSGTIRDNLEIDLHIGNSSGGIYTFDGIIDEVRVWSIARSGGQIYATMEDTLTGSEMGLVGYWKMNEGSGTDAGDASQHGHEVVLEASRWAQGIHLGLSGEYDPHDGANPSRLVLESPYPNPFNKSTAIRFRLPQKGLGIVALYDINGNRVRILAEGYLAAGSHALQWDGTNDFGEPAPSGVYFCTLEAASFSTSRPVVLAR
jgi:hypothetical protein